MPEPDQHILLAKWLEGSLTDEEAKALGNPEELNGLKNSLGRVEKYDFPPVDEAAIFNKVKNPPSKKVVLKCPHRGPNRPC